MEDLRNASAGRGQSRHSKVLPVPPPSVETGVRGKTNPFPSAQRELPPIPKTNMSSIPRRPVGGGAGAAGQADSIESSKVQVRPIYEQFMKKESIDYFQTERTPPPPPKDNKSRELPGLPEPPTHLHSNSTSSISSTKSSPRPEIWKRRSPKGDRSPSISELKLTKSNGSTASLASISQSSPGPAPQHSLPPLPTQPSRAIIGLPGRTIKKPVPARPAPPQLDPMGNQLSKSLKLGKKDRAGEAESSKIVRKLPESQISPYTRLPTPDYQLNENQVASLLVPPALSPVSPETPPRDLSPDPRPDLAQPPDKIVSLKDREVPNLLVPGPPRPPRESSLALNIIDEYAIPRSPYPQKQSVSSISTIRQRPPSQDTKTWPSMTDTPETPRKIHPSAALSVVHFNCYHSHRQMRTSRNDVCPLGCMVCEVKDTEKRWTCTWCSLRCCEPCMKGLETIPGKDLGKFLDRIGRSDRLHEREVNAGT
jgi:hypothetical protein